MNIMNTVDIPVFITHTTRPPAIKMRNLVL